ncbi:MAG: hypothetical protein KDB80_11960 [Planctomycetes bacterium]|nr:hypothetical protein [Planctomycetota bacterium]
MIRLLSGCAILVSASALAAQNLPAGYDSEVRTLPDGVQAVCEVIGLGAVYYDAGDVVLDDGASTTVLYSVPGAPAFASFCVLVDDAIVFGESSVGNLYRIPLLGGPPGTIANLPFNYDAAVFGDLLLVSAKTNIASGDNDIVAVDPVSGATTPIALLPGFSGPLTVDEQGDLHYAIPRAASADILTFSASQIDAVLAGGPVLTEAEATISATGLPSAVSIAVDHDGDLFVSDYTVPAIFEVSRDPSGDATFELVSYSFTTPQPGALVYRGLLKNGMQFEPFQPSIGLGKSLSIVEASFGSTTLIRTLTPARARLAPSVADPVPVGPFSIDVAGLAPNATAALLLALHSASNPPITRPLFEQALFFGVDLGVVILSVGTPIDANGDGSVPFGNPGFGRSFSFQALFLDNSGPLPVVGTTNERTVVFQ